MAQNKVSVVIDGKEFVSKEAQSASKSLTSLGNTSQKVSKLIRAGVLTAVAASVAGIMSTIKVARSSLEEAAKMEQIDTSFNVLIGNAEKAKEILSDLREFSAATPLEFETIATGAQNLMAFGIEADDVLDKMRMLGNVSQGQEDKLDSVGRAYGKIKAKGKASLEELNMMTEAGIPILQGIADNLGVSTEELFKMVSAGKIGFTEVDEALQAMTTGTGQFAGMLEKQAGTFSGLVSTYKDNISLAMDEIGQSMLPAAKTITEGLIGGIQRFRDSDAFDSLKTSFTNLGTWITDVVKEGGPFNSMVSAFVKFVAWSVNMIPKIGSVFTFVGTVIGITAETIQEQFQDTWDTFTGFLDDLGLLDAIKSTINITVQAVGDTYQAIKDGLATGDWSTFWGVGSDVLSKGLGIGLSIYMAAGGVASAITSLQSGFGLPVTGKMAAGAGIGILSVFIALKEAQTTGNWDDFASDLTAAIVGGFIAAGLTKSPQAGVWTTSILMSLGIGSGIEDFVENVLPAPEEVADQVKQWFHDAVIQPITDAWNSTTWQSIIKPFDIVGNALDIGTQVKEGFIEGLGEAEDEGKGWFGQFIAGAKNVLDIHSPSKKFQEIGGFILQGLESGLSDSESVGASLGNDLVSGMEGTSYASRISEAWNTLMDSLRANSSINIDAEVNGIMGTGGSSPGSTPESTTSSDGGGFKEFLKSIWEGMKGFVGVIKDSIGTLSSFKAIVRWSTTILTGVMDVLGPIIDDALAPMVRILKILGQTLGRIIAPVFRMLGEVVSWLAEGFVWFYNKAIVPVGNFMMKLFAKVGNFFISIINGVISAINWIPGVNIKKVSSISADQDALTTISLEELSSSGSTDSSTYAGGTTGSNTSVQQLDINVYQYYNAPVIGESGLEQVGGFVVRAIQEYIGSGGTVEFIKG